uniref:Gasdermin pore forming domain-containing protein n=1 Tax=Denticeps clupeoides TaxID=299321 RepID=A0AAY4BEL9_9TELE
MLGKATGHLVRQIDPDGSLIGVSRLADSDRLQPLGVVLKRPGRWPWSRAKYTQTHNSILPLCCMKVFVFVWVTDEYLCVSDCAELITTDFMNYKGTYTEKMGGALHAEMGGARMQAEGRGSSQLQSSFGKLRKEVVNVRMLLDSSEDRLVDLHHPLVQQTGSQLGSVLAVLKQRIITSSPCSIMFSDTPQNSAVLLFCNVCGFVLTTWCVLFCVCSQVSVSESTSVQLDSDVSMEIPPNTVLAYSVIDLLIKENGNYEFCLQPEVQGGFASGRTSRPAGLGGRGAEARDGRRVGGVSGHPGPAPSAAVCCCPWVELPEQHGDIPCAIVTTQGSRTTQQMMMMDDGDDANVPEVQQMLAELFHVENFAF